MDTYDLEEDTYDTQELNQGDINSLSLRVSVTVVKHHDQSKLQMEAVIWASGSRGLEL